MKFAKQCGNTVQILRNTTAIIDCNTRSELHKTEKGNLSPVVLNNLFNYNSTFPGTQKVKIVYLTIRISTHFPSKNISTSPHSSTAAILHYVIVNKSSPLIGCKWTVNKVDSIVFATAQIQKPIPGKRNFKPNLKKCCDELKKKEMIIIIIFLLFFHIGTILPLEITNHIGRSPIKTMIRKYCVCRWTVLA